MADALNNQKESLWTGIKKNVWGFLKNSWHFLLDTAEAWIKGATKWALDTADMLWDVSAFATDVTGITDNAWSKEGFLDRNVKDIKWAIDDNDLVKSKWGESDAGKTVLGWAETIGEIFTPGIWAIGAAWKTIKWFRYGKEAIAAMKNEPKLIKELNDIRMAKGKIDGERLSQLVEKYGLDKTLAQAGKISNQMKESKLPDLIKNNPRAAEIVKKLSKMDEKEVAEVVSKYPRLKDWMTGKLAKTVLAWWIWSAITSDSNDDWISLPEVSPTEDDMKHLEDLIPQDSVDTKTKDTTNTQWDLVKDHYGYKITKTPNGKFAFESNDPTLPEGTIKEFDSLEEAQKDIEEWNKDAIASGKEIVRNKKSEPVTDKKDPNVNTFRSENPNAKPEVDTTPNKYAQETKIKNELADLLDKENWINTYEQLASRYGINLSPDFDSKSPEDLKNLLNVIKLEGTSKEDKQKMLSNETTPTKELIDEAKIKKENQLKSEGKLTDKTLTDPERKGKLPSEVIKMELKRAGLNEDEEGLKKLSSKFWINYEDSARGQQNLYRAILEEPISM